MWRLVLSAFHCCIVVALRVRAVGVFSVRRGPRGGGPSRTACTYVHGIVLRFSYVSCLLDSGFVGGARSAVFLVACVYVSLRTQTLHSAKHARDWSVRHVSS